MYCVPCGWYQVLSDCEALAVSVEPVR